MSEEPADGRPRREPDPGPPALPDRADDDRDVGWGERPDDDDERFTRERPPHW